MTDLTAALQDEVYAELWDLDALQLITGHKFDSIQRDRLGDTILTCGRDVYEIRVARIEDGAAADLGPYPPPGDLDT